jgi:hypothetical protein
MLKTVHCEEDFTELCDNMEAQHTALLHCRETRWLSRAKVIRKVSGLKEAAAIFLSESNDNDDAELCYKEIL